MKATVHKCIWSNKELNIASIDTYDIELRSDTLKQLQDLVGGLIDVYHHEPSGRDWIINDEGIVLEMPLNNWALQHGLHLCGTIVEIHGLLP